MNKVLLRNKKSGGLGESSISINDPRRIRTIYLSSSGHSLVCHAIKYQPPASSVIVLLLAGANNKLQKGE